MKHWQHLPTLGKHFLSSFPSLQPWAWLGAVARGDVDVLEVLQLFWVSAGLSGSTSAATSRVTFLGLSWSLLPFEGCLRQLEGYRATLL